MSLINYYNFKTAAALGLKAPVDGFTPEEKQLSKLLATATIHGLYAKLPTARMKAIVALHFELGYSQEIVAQMFCIKQASLADEIALIQRILLGKEYKPRRNKPEITKEEAQQILERLGFDEYL